MKSIKKITNKVTDNFSALAGSALLVGATLTGGAALASAQSGSSGNSMDLGDYPTPFVTDDGEVETSIVLGSDAQVTDVVGATEIAGSLGAAAFGEESVSVSAGGVSGTWSAENGITLNRQNSDLFLNDQTNAEETRLDDSDLNVLETTAFQSAEDEEVEVEQEVQVGAQNQGFYPAGDNDDPLLHVVNPTNPDNTTAGNLFSAEVEFDETIDFTADGEDRDSPASGADEYIEDGDEIEMFGGSYTFSDESTDDELVFYGSSDRVEVNTGESTTLTVDGEEVSVEATYVADSDPITATVAVGGSTERVEEGDSVGPNGNIRISDIYRTGPDGQGRVAFSQGSQELVINHGTQSNLGDVEVDNDDVDGVQVEVDGDNFNTTDGMTFYFGAADSDEDYVAAGETYEDPLFGLEFHYGGLTGDTAENPAEAIDVTAAEDGNAEITVNDPSGDSANVAFRNNDESDTVLAHDSGDTYATVEGEALSEDDRVVLNSNEESGLYEVTDITNDVNDLSSSFSGEDFGVTLQNVVTGESVEIDETDLSSSDDEANPSTSYGYSGNVVELQGESVEGKDFDVVFSSDGLHFFRTGESDTQVFPTLYTETDAGVVFTQQTQVETNPGNKTETYELPSTTVSGENTVTVNYTVNNDGNNHVDVDIGNDGAYDDDISVDNGGASSATFTAEGETVYNLTVDADSGSNNNFNASIAVDADQDTSGSSAVLGPAAGVIMPEDDEDEEHGYFFEPDVSDGSDGSLNNLVYTGETQRDINEDTDISEDGWVTNDLDSEDNVEVGYNDYGAYTRQDTDADVEFNLHLPSGQSTAGMAVTGPDGEISAEGSTGGGSAMAASPTGQFAAGVLADDGNVGQVKNNDNIIVVGGPAANSLTQELVDENQTMPASDYTSGQGMIQMVDGWSEGNNALVVAGATGEDTRAAAEFLADYRNNQDALEGQSQVTVETSSGTVVE